MVAFISALINRQYAACKSVLIDLAKAEKKKPGGSSFGPLFGTFIVANLLKRLCQVEAGSAGILNWGGPFLRAGFFFRYFLVVVVVQLVSRHSCVADRLPVVVRFPAGPRVRLKTVDPPKGNGLGKKSLLFLSF